MPYFDVFRYFISLASLVACFINNGVYNIYGQP
jgi:hypothetical protein